MIDFYICYFVKEYFFTVLMNHSEAHESCLHSSAHPIFK